MPKVVEPRSFRQAVCRVGACLAALAAFERLRGPVTADAGISDGQAPAVTEGVPPCDLAEPVGDDYFAWSGAKALDVRTDFVQHPFVGWNRPGRCLSLEVSPVFGRITTYLAFARRSNYPTHIWNAAMITAISSILLTTSVSTRTRCLNGFIPVVKLWMGGRPAD